MQYDPVMAALVKERGPSHRDYFAVVFQEKLIALALEGRVDVRQPQPALLRQVRDVIRREREAQAAGRALPCDPAALIAEAVEHARLDMRENPVERILRQLSGVERFSESRSAGARRKRKGLTGDPAGIIAEICTRRRIGRQDLMGPCRRQDWAMARFELFYRLRSETDLSYKAIGQMVGNRHHSTVLHGVREWRRLNHLPDPVACFSRRRANPAYSDAA